ncbi:MAG: ABC transporter permease subunit [Sporichthyaceae bacterium]
MARIAYVTGAIDTTGVPRPEPFGISLDSDRAYYWWISAIVVALLLVLQRLRTTRYGRAMIAAGADPEMAATFGISPGRYRLLAFVVAGFCAGVAGVLQAGLFRNPPGVLQYIAYSSLAYLAVAVLAGNASLLAVVAAAVAIQVTPLALLGWGLNVYLVAGVGMVVGVLLGPRGLGGVVIDLFTRRPSLPPDAFGEPVVHAGTER